MDYSEPISRQTYRRLSYVVDYKIQGHYSTAHFYTRSNAAIPILVKGLSIFLSIKHKGFFKS